MQNEGFEVGSDYVAARVSFDIDSTGITNLKELSKAMSDFQTVAVAAGRSSESFTGYLQKMTEVAKQATEAQTQLVAQLQRITDVQQSAMTGQGTQINRGVPVGYIDPFSGMGSGTGGQAQRMPATMSGASSYLGGMAQQDPRQYMNFQAQRGNLRTGDVPAQSPNDQDLEQHAMRHARREEEQVRRNHGTAGGGGGGFAGLQNKISSFSSGAGQLLNELAPGGDFAGPVGMLQKGLSGMARASGAVKVAGSAAAETGEAGTLAGLGGMAGAAALGIGIPLAGMGLVQAGGNMVQGYRSMGQQRGGGAEDGMGYEMAIRSMALNPFITTDQARQIVSSGLSSGYTGKEFDTVTQFMASNLKDMNVSVADSMKMFKKNVGEGGMTEEGMGGMMAVLKKLAQNGGQMTQADIVSSFASTSSALINAGVSGPSAASAGAANAMVYAQYDDIKGLGAQMVQAAAGSDASQAMIGAYGGYSQELQGVDPAATMETLGGDKSSTAVYNTLSHFAQQINKQGGDASFKVRSFQGILRNLFPGIDWSSRTKVQKLFTQALQGNPFPAAQQKERQANVDASKVESRSGVAQAATGVGAVFGGLIHGAADLVVGGAKTLWKGKTPDGGIFKGTDDFMARMSDAGTADHITLMDAVTEQNGGSRNIEVGDGDKWSKFKANDRAQLEALRDGKLKWRRANDGSAGTLLSETTSQGQSGAGNGAPNMFDGGKGQVNVGGSVTIKIDQDGRVKDTSPREVRLSPNTQQAQSGYGNAQLNNPPPGDTPGINGYDLSTR